jgi:predicted transport protein
MSDKPFRAKRDMKDGFADSPIRMNKSLANLERWNEEEIRKRAESVAELAVKVWGIPSMTTEVLNGFRRAGVSGGARAYTLADHHDVLKGKNLDLFEKVRKRILNLDSSVREEIKKHYIAYKVTTNFVDIEPQKNRFRITLNMPYNEIDDPEKTCRDVTNVGHYGNGDVEFGLSSPDQIEYAMCLIRQSFERQSEDWEA